MTVVMRSRLGGVQPMAAADWHAPATAAERQLLRSVGGPVLDLGCGPGRLVAAAADLGFAALGIDASPLAVASAREQGLPVLLRSVFDPLPGEGRWRSVLLIDGNIGIGGDPTRLLGRSAALLGIDGVLVVEVGPPGSPSALGEARLEHSGERSDWFPWAWVGADDVDTFGAGAGLRRRDWWTAEDRWFAVLERMPT